MSASALAVPSAGFDAHDWISAGMPVAKARKLMDSLKHIAPKQFFATLGISERTFQRRVATKGGTLDANASDRAWRLMSVLDQASDVFGSREVAEQWLIKPAFGLQRQVPLELLQTSEGTEIVRRFLRQIDHGVYV